MADLNQSPTASLYTEMPYPGDGVVRTIIGDTLRASIEEYTPRISGDGLIVDVGCGTGENTCGIRHRFPNATVVGVDINPASLDLARKLGARMDVEFRHGDLLIDLPRVLDGRKADIAVSVGVLHHLDDPQPGFQAVRDVTAPGGLFLGYVYSLFGRWNERAVTALLDEAVGTHDPRRRASVLAALGLSSSHTMRGFLSTLNRRRRFGPPLKPLELARVAVKRDRLVHVADTFSNPREHFFKFADLEAMLEKTGWELHGLAPLGGLPRSAREFTNDADAVQALDAMPRSAMYDVFAYRFQYEGFLFVATPA